MTLSALAVAILVVLLSTAVGTWLLRRYAVARQLMDVPNERSSHHVATPRGGGLAFVVVYSVTLVWLIAGGYGSWAALTGLLGAGLLVAAIGFVDDHGHVAARWRLLAHGVAALWLLAWLGMPLLSIAGFEIAPGWWGYVVFAVALVWLLNLFNFMDGIDGIAGVEAVSVCLGGALCYWLIGRPYMSVPVVLLAFSVLGFLVWNWPPAKIFMGDAGSGFLGLMIGGLALQAALVDPGLLWCWLILLGVFAVDATFTLLRRLVSGHRIYEAHRSHAYQHAARRHGSHLPVTSVVLLLNVIWLLPLACLVALGHLDGLLAMLVAYAPLLLITWRYGAGNQDTKND